MFSILKKMYNMAGDLKGRIITSLVSQIFDNTLSFVPVAMVLVLFKKIIEDSLNLNFVIISFVVMVASIALRSIARMSMDKNSYAVTLNIFYNEKLKIADHLKNVNMGFYTDDNLGRVNNTLINGMAFLEEKFLHTLLDFVGASANVVIAGIVLLILNPIIGLIYIVTVILVILILNPYEKSFSKHTVKSNIANEDLTSSIIEYVKNISVIKAFHLLGKHERSNKAFTDRLRTDLAAEKINIPYLLAAMCVMSISTTLMIYYVLSQYQNAPIYTAILLAIMAIYIYTSLLTIVLAVGSISSAKNTLKIIDELYAEKTLEVIGDKKPISYNIEFENVKFAYDKTNVVDGISFSLKENTMNALVGLSGSGKSTLVNLIPRFFDVNEGSISIGGVNIKEMSQETLNSCISMVFQNVYLFNDTIYNNIAFGNQDATKEDVIEASKKAKCYDFITKLPEGFDTKIGEAGLNLSGGERQRISIARAILKNSPIILLDEATASIDADNERDIQLAINELVKDKTILVIAHKLSCVKNADQILVIDRGKLIDSGTHTELIKKEGLYKNLCQRRANSKAWVIENSCF